MESAATIKLTQNKKAIIDAEDFDKISKHKWYAWLDCGKWRARRSIPGGKAEVMARAIIGATKSNEVVDHINGDSLDNRKTNLRIVDNYINQQNRGVNKNNKLKEKNVVFDGKYYRVYIMRFGKRISKVFKTLDDAIKFRNSYGITPDTEGSSEKQQEI